MANLTAEEFLRQVRMVSEANDIALEDINFTMQNGMRCSWYAPEEELPDIHWTQEMGMRQ